MSTPGERPGLAAVENLPDALPAAMERFAVSVALHPQRLAVRADDGSLTFAQLDNRVSAAASAMLAAGVRSGDVVGVLIGRSVLLPVAFLAAWRIGAAYLPMDPGYPAARLAYMADDAGVSAIMTAGPIPWETNIPTVDARLEHENTSAAYNAGELAYVIYTSGTSGVPKGVEVTQAGVSALIDGLERSGAYSAELAVVAWNASASFDASVQQWVRVVRGDTIVLLGDQHRTDAGKLADLLNEARVTDLDLTPSHWPHIRSAVLGAVSAQRPLRLFVGGEALPAAMWQELARSGSSGLTAFNLYGPTECTVDSTLAHVVGHEPHIGSPLPGVEVYVLDEQLAVVAEGEPGELYIGGRQVARGYRNNTGLTAARFVAVPGVGDRLYRTGDKVRWAGSVLEFLGRIDRQVKVGGYRIEPAEIEQVLTIEPTVGAAAVAVRVDAHGAEVLVAFVVPRPESTVDEATLRSHCAALLPAFMQPAAYVLLDKLPLNASGKVDQAQLPDLPSSNDAEGGDIAQLIAGVWEDLLGVEVGPEDNFFVLGGHSLLAIRVVSRLKHQFGITMAIGDVYENPQLSKFVAAAQTQKDI